MSDKNRRQYIDVPLREASGKTHNRIEVFYHRGGMNYFTGKNDMRGYYLGVQPMSKGEHSVSYELFSGAKTLVKGTKRYSQKELDALGDKLLPHAEEFSDLFVNKEGNKFVEKLQTLVQGEEER